MAFEFAQLKNDLLEKTIAIQKWLKKLIYMRRLKEIITFRRLRALKVQYFGVLVVRKHVLLENQYYLALIYKNKLLYSIVLYSETQ